MARILALAVIFFAGLRSYAVTLYKSGVTASYYADKFHGRKTSSGEIFNMYDYTAAHKTLPFGTLLRVTNLANGNYVTVKVNDRGPFVKGRELDVSKAAAVKLGMIKTGTAK
ncbi:MAG: septal ring lytic transglycosylase RlpA family protein, partial [Treponema sp.]|nr:septal ring lytic transglycosylase RlpA family protein [Treponema sp.]